MSAARAGLRPVITGIGAVTPSGIGTEEHWRSTLRGELRVGPITSFDASRYATTLAGEVTGFDPADHIGGRIILQTDRWTWLGMAATGFALTDAAYDPAAYDPYATSVVFGAGSGGNDFGQREIQRLWSRGRQAVSVYQSIAWFYAATTGQTSIQHGIKGPSGVVVSDDAGGLDSLAQARRTIRRGTPVVLAGGAEAGLTPYALTCQTTSGRLSTSREPRGGYKPFDRDAGGHVPAEGGATLVVEDPASAAARGAPGVYAEIAGYAATHDAYHHRDPTPDPRWYAEAMRRALADARLTPADVDVIFADGAGSRDLDEVEARAIHAAFGAHAERVPVTAPQGLTGRMSAGGSALAAVNAVLSIRDGVIPAVGNLDDPAPEYRLDLVRVPREAPVRVAMVNARGYGGFNSSLILRAVDPATTDGGIR
ncbi:MULTISPECIES: beta-ketoacyl synthase N-terminal-like domain-containing protein [Protofrankia]|uniref:Beta-ketoacyl-acyl-carrier-protein synthase II n=1 Tax=Candidatus Protofrankia datiscae TaxID=2716812 RepID=F8B5H5_9ACTN|nr:MULTISPECIES: beta-ketoacyl synthase N-terminal-like domain-containing protein [Protofrankia]AEH08034.1 Beta-ketoacyl-acyl-carrier-protein synthase II [Candidatus Protofrankia datiscae]